MTAILVNRASLVVLDQQAVHSIRHRMLVLLLKIECENPITVKHSFIPRNFNTIVHNNVEVSWYE